LDWLRWPNGFVCLLLGLGLDAVDLVAVAVHQCHPSAFALRVPPVCLVDDPAHHLGGVFDHAGRPSTSAGLRGIGVTS